MRRTCLSALCVILASTFAAAQPAADLPKVEALIVEQTNQFRKEQERTPVTTDKTLTQAAAEFAQFMAKTDEYGHEADGRTPSQRAKAAGYEYCLVMENIAMQFRTNGFPTQELAKRFVQGWIDSPGHRRNMVDPDVMHIGVGVARSARTGRFYAVQLFGRPESAMINFQVSNQSGRVVEYSLGEERFSLKPRQTQTHGVCRPVPLTFAAPQPREYHPENGMRYTVLPSDRGLNIRTGRMETR